MALILQSLTLVGKDDNLHEDQLKNIKYRILSHKNDNEKIRCFLLLAVTKI
jgi:hypothetical protein